MFIAAWPQSETNIVYRDENGSETIRSGGSRSWRNCNPGNISKGSFAESCGSIGGDARFAIFPDEDTGLAAIRTLLTGKAYRSMTLREAIYKYAPPSDGNNADSYLKSITNDLNVDSSTTIASLSEEQIHSLANAIKKHEGWIAGSITSVRDAASKFVQSIFSTDLTNNSADRLSILTDLHDFIPPESKDSGHITDLIEIGRDPTKCAKVREKSFHAMIKIYGRPTAHNACACTLSMFLREAGIDVDVEYNAGRLARTLEKDRSWRRIKLGRQQAGDVAVTLDKTKPVGADHIFLVVDAIDADKMMIADNQGTVCPHERYASGKGKTPVDYFLRASNPFTNMPILTSHIIETDTQFESVENDEETNDIVISYNDDVSKIVTA